MFEEFNFASVMSLIGVIIVMIKLVFWIKDTQKVHRNKSIELIHNAFKEPNYLGREFVIEQLMEVQYKAHIPFTHIEFMLSHHRSSDLLRFYRRGIKFLNTENGSFELKEKWRGKSPRVAVVQNALLNLLYLLLSLVFACAFAYATLSIFRETLNSDKVLAMLPYIILCWISSALTGVCIGLAIRIASDSSSPRDAYQFMSALGETNRREMQSDNANTENEHQGNAPDRVNGNSQTMKPESISQYQL
ncbi:hypothetical protein [Veronia pacifica]|uniref:Uncharacterized protein n=1 Tax=Veronia pacifica TaxID=1080227 RepID=A0A1C3ELB5_9GAMM|nr:hypothetical protein [Veronia pacifica]ODA34010.1 hypothetical protein A8L45_08160 [Veronia pacifica]